MFGITTVHLIHMHALLTVIKNKLTERFVTFWKKRMLNDESMKKLRTYMVLKQNFGIESYLDDIYDKSVRKGLSSFRISAHKLRIERGRYFGEKPEDRLCTICNVVEDEIHFLWQCHKYASQRKTLYDSVEDSNVLLSLDSSRTFVELMTNDNKTVMKAIGKYIKECSITWLLKWIQNDT